MHFTYPSIVKQASGKASLAIETSTTLLLASGETRQLQPKQTDIKTNLRKITIWKQSRNSLATARKDHLLNAKFIICKILKVHHMEMKLVKIVSSIEQHVKTRVSMFLYRVLKYNDTCKIIVFRGISVRSWH